MNKRLYYIDFLRVLAILLMFCFHVSMVFVADWHWHIKNPETSYLLLEINFWLSSFRMPLLFFVSGYISYVLLARMRISAFISQRFQRLIIPTIIWTFLLVAPQIYFERKLAGDEQSYATFYQSFLTFQWWPDGDFHWLHLWFIPYLFCYNLLSVPVFLILERQALMTSYLKKAFSGPLALVAFALLAIIPYAILWPHYVPSYDLINDHARHVFYLFFIVGGMLYYKISATAHTLETNRQLFLRLALLSMAVIDVIRWNGWEPIGFWQYQAHDYRTYLYQMLLSFNSWMWVYSCLGYGKRYLNHDSQILTYANTAVYPFYILHQTVLVVIAYYVVQTQDSIALKLMFLLLLCFCVTTSIYHLFIKPYGIMRYLFGMKQLKPQA